MVDFNPLYRNNRRNFYQEKGPDSASVGSIINVFKTKPSKNSYDSSHVVTVNPVNGVTAYSDVTGNAYPENNPEYQYMGYLYCDGSEYNIKDYPLLYSIIGNEYGGTSGDAVTVVSGGSGYSVDTIITFSSPPSPGITATGKVVIEGGVITKVNIVKPGSGYISAPSATLSSTNGGFGANFYIRIDSNGALIGILPENIFEFWPDEYLGTLKVPDLKAKKIVGYGPVYGTGTPTIGNIEMQVGINSIGGQWYFSKESQTNYFNLGQVKTTGYTDVIATVTGRISGSQNITVTLDDNDIPQVPPHSHLLYHSEAPQIVGLPGGGVVDPYLTGYRNKSGSIVAFSPSGGIKLTHSHALSKKKLSGQNIATYDVFNFKGGDQGPGSIKNNGNYYASGESGQFVDVTYTPSPTFKKFSESSIIGGVVIVDDGQPVYNIISQEYTTAGSYTYSIGASVSEIDIELFGGGGSGGVWTTAGNSGGDTTVQLGDGSALTIVAGGGQGGGAASENTSSALPYSESFGYGGYSGTNAISGSGTSDFSTIVVTEPGTDVIYDGKNGADGKLWKVTYPDGVPTDANGFDQWTGKGGGGIYAGAVAGGGSDGKYLFVSGGSSKIVSDVTYPSTATFSVDPTDPAKYSVQNGYITLLGADGADCGNLVCATGYGISGKQFTVSIKPDNNGDISGAFKFYPGQGGQAYPNTASATYGGTGGRAGDGYSNNDGGGGGAATIVTYVTNAGAEIIVAGAGGGGGGGGFGEGQCGDNGTTNSITDGVQDVGSQSLFSGAGGFGGNYGCTGGGGGGGGGGIGTSGQTSGSQGGGDSGGATGGGVGGGGGGTGGHGGGYGGARGLSSYRSDIFSLVSSGNSPETNGRIYGSVAEDRSYWTSAAGGGGSGGYIYGTITEELLQSSGASSLTIQIGAGATGVSKSLNRTLDSSISWSESSGTITSSSGTDGYVKIQAKTQIGFIGGTEFTTVGDLVMKASAGIQLYSSGTGTGTAGGFKLPVTQVPVVEIVPQGNQPGSGAAASCTVTNSLVIGVSLGNGGGGYTSPPKVRFLHGCGSGTSAVTTINGGVVDNITLVAGATVYAKYVKFGGSQLERYIILAQQDCTNVERFGVKACRGNNINGGERPDDSSDDLLLYYNTDGSDNFPDTNYVGVIVPRPSDADIANNYDGTGTGSNPTNWYSYFLNLPGGAKKPGVKFKIVQKRATATGNNDNGGNTDQYGICDFVYEYDLISETQFQTSPGEISSNAKILEYTIEGSSNSLYPAGVDVNDMTFAMSSGVPLTPVPALEPVKSIPLLEPYALTKYLIKAF